VLGNVVPDVGAAIGSIAILLSGVGGLASTTIRAEQRRRMREGVDANLTTILVDAIESLRIPELRPSLAFSRPSIALSRPSTASARLVRDTADALVQDRAEADSAATLHKGIDLLGVIFAVGSGLLYGCQGLFLSKGGNLANGASMMLAQLPLMLLFGGLRWLLFVPSSPADEDGIMTLGAALLALISGGLFGVGFVGQVYVLSDFGDAVGTPLTQANLVVASLWSILAFREIQGVDLICFFVASSALVHCGVTMLAVFN